DQCPVASDLRPYGLGVHDGVVYLGAVCTAESTVAPGSLPLPAPTNTQDPGPRPGDTSKLRAYVFTWNGDTANPSFTTALTFPLNYDRGCVTYNQLAGCERKYDAHWAPWVNTFPFTTNGANISYEAMYPQPILSNIEFNNDDLILFFIDRWGQQTSAFTQ